MSRSCATEEEKRRHSPRTEFKKRERVKSETPKARARKSDLAEGHSYLRVVFVFDADVGSLRTDRSALSACFNQRLVAMRISWQSIGRSETE